MNDPAAEPVGDGYVRVSRVFRAPREIVFEAFVDPDQVAKWWAPEGFDVPRDTVDIDAREGGRLHFTMVDSRSGAEYPVHFEIAEIARPELLVLTAEAVPDVGVMEPTVTRVVFEDDGEGTRVTVTQGPHDEAMLRNADLGWQGSFEKLAAVLES